MDTHYFVSYSRSNLGFVERLRTDLEKHGIPIWWDKVGLKPGTSDWEQTLRDAIRAANAVLLVASPVSRRSSYVRDELAIAHMYKKPVIPLWAEGDEWMDSIPMGLGYIQNIDMRAALYNSGLDQLLTTLTGTLTLPQAAEEQVLPPTFIPRNPYKGLNAFRADDQLDFFGRSNTIRDLLERLQRSNFLAVIGASGSGKSSVIMAGLLPALEKSAPPGSLFIDPFVPGAHPLENLTAMLARCLPGKSQHAIREDLDDRSTRGLLRLAKELLPHAKSRLILYVDQFEELFTLATDERQPFINLLTSAVSEPDSPVILILSLRADFYDRPLNDNALGALLREHTYPILPLSLDDLREAVEDPVRMDDVRVEFEDGLVAELVFTVREEPGALPLLQFTLDQLFRECIKDNRRILTWEAYNALGGVSGALAKHAEDTYKNLSSEEQKLAQALFLRLIEPGATEQDTTRRRAALEELTLVESESSKRYRQVADRFVAARLLTTNRIAGVDTIEVSHEALIREWRRLRDWLREARDDIKLQNKLNEDAADWLARNRSSDALYRGRVLLEAMDWATYNILNAAESAFLQASSSYEQQQIIAEERRKQELFAAADRAEKASNESAKAVQRARQTRRVSFIVVGLLTLFAVISVGLLLQVSTVRSQLDTDIITAQANLDTVATAVIEQQNQAEALRLAGLANSALSRHENEQAALLSIRSLRTAYTVEADMALQQTLPLLSHRQFAGHTARVRIAISPDNRYIVSESADGTSRLWDIASGNEVWKSDIQSMANSLVFSPDGRYILSAGKKTYLRDAVTGKEIHQFAGHTDTVYSAAFSPDSRTIVTGGGEVDSSIRLWDAATGAEIRRFMVENTGTYSLAFSPDGQYLLSGGVDVQLWEIASGKEIRRFNRKSAGWLLVWCAGFSPDGRYVFAGDIDGKIQVWDAATGEETYQLIGHSDDVLTALFSSNNTVLMSGSSDGTVRLWDWQTPEEIYRFFLDSAPVENIVFSVDGYSIVAAYEDGMIRLWKRSNQDFEGFRQLLNKMPVAAISVVFSPNGQYVASGNRDGKIRLWDVNRTEEIARISLDHDQPYAIDFSPDGRYLLSGSVNGIVQLWDVSNGQEVWSFDTEHGGTIWSVRFSPDGRYALAGTGEGDATLWLWDVETGATAAHLDIGYMGQVNRVTFSPDGRYILGSGFGHTKLWDVVTGAEVRVFDEQQEKIYAVSFSPDQQSILTGSETGIVRLWDVTTGTETRQFEGHTDIVVSVDFSPDGRYFLSASRDGTIRLREVSTGKEIRRFVDLSVRSAVFSPDGRAIVSGGDAGVIHWLVDHESVIAGVCNVLYRDFSRQERLLYAIQDSEPTCTGNIAGAAVKRTSGETIRTPFATSTIPVFTPLPTLPASITPTVPFKFTQFTPTPVRQPSSPTITPTATAFMLELTSFPTKTIPVFTPLGTLPPTVTPVFTPNSVSEAHIGMNLGEIAIGGGELWSYHGQAGEILTLWVEAKHPLGRSQDSTGLLDVEFILISPDGEVLATGIGDPDFGITDAVIDDFTLPETGLYQIEVRSYKDETGGEYTLTVESKLDQEN